MSDPVNGSGRADTSRRTPGIVIAGTVLLIVGAVGFAGFGLFYLIGGIIDLSTGISATMIAFTVTMIGAGLCALAAGLIVPAAGLLRGRLRARAGASTCAIIGVVIALVAAVLSLGVGNLIPVAFFTQVIVLSVGMAMLRSAGATRPFTH
ncbi:MAG: hypothetical protein JST33_15365 [Actinobacteria bacterium]|nr:hypothetical protein [Actinomycetota bacterium]